MTFSTDQRRNWFAAGVAAICFVVGITLSHLMEPGVRVQKVTLVKETPALKFIPAGSGPHPVALLAHGDTASKETLFRYAEALAAAGFVCFDIDLPGHGASLRTSSFMETVSTLEAVARQVGPVDVFVGHSMGGFTGGEAVREGGMRPGLFIAIGSMPVLGDHAPPLLLLAGRFDEAFSPALLKSRTDARVVISSGSDHILELWDPRLVNTAVLAACASVHSTPPAPPIAWRWRLIGAVLAIVAAGKLASCLTDLFPRLARFRGLFIAVFVVVAFTLAIGGRWLDATPHLRFLSKQGIAMAVIFLLAMISGKLRIPRWSFATLGVLVMVIAACWLKASGSLVAALFVLFTLAVTPTLVAGAAIGAIAARRESRLQGDIAMAIIVGCAAFQWMEAPRSAPVEARPHVTIKLDPKDYDAYLGQYLFAPDNRFWSGLRLTISLQGDQLVGQGQVRMPRITFNVHLYPESETNFFLNPKNDQELTFVKNEKGQVTGVIFHRPGSPDSEGKKVSG